MGQPPKPAAGIIDKVTFDAMVHEPRQLAALYTYTSLEILIDIAYGIASDFIKRPHIFVSSGGPNITNLLGDIRFRYGFDPYHLSPVSRRQIYIPYFGYSLGEPPDMGHDFVRLRNQLNAAATSFAERVYDTGVEMLRERVRAAHRPFKAYLMGLNGDALVWTIDKFANLSEGMAYTLLRTPEVARIYSGTIAPRASWPYALDANGDKLVEEASSQTNKYDGGPVKITRERFTSVQRIALRGADAIVAILDYDEAQDEDRARPNQLDNLITRCYVWGAALDSYEGAMKPL
jgi:hypothetical protein